ncbi:hypothetical protein BV22DRAFT_1132251 [Leucogyrophana mollusca]|uniref:Uncharacterized protein n=1 Tax=Leucogyrophana mollusca TaxID=85980 RepID=A0ACB8B983_9AGAM|nr:hypothetical protein BV22DRAFT_1132251 [Leucogyrophana mollusca]
MASQLNIGANSTAAPIEHQRGTTGTSASRGVHNTVPRPSNTSTSSGGRSQKRGPKRFRKENRPGFNVAGRPSGTQLRQESELPERVQSSSDDEDMQNDQYSYPDHDLPHDLFTPHQQPYHGVHDYQQQQPYAHEQLSQHNVPYAQDFQEHDVMRQRQEQEVARYQLQTQGYYVRQQPEQEGIERGQARQRTERPAPYAPPGRRAGIFRGMNRLGADGIGTRESRGSGVRLVAAFRPDGPQPEEYRNGVINATETHIAGSGSLHRTASLPIPQRTPAPAPAPSSSVQPTVTPTTRPDPTTTTTGEAPVARPNPEPSASRARRPWRVVVPETLLSTEALERAKVTLLGITLNKDGILSKGDKARTVDHALETAAQADGIHPPYKWAPKTREFVFDASAKLRTHFKQVSHMFVQMGFPLHAPIRSLDSDSEYKQRIVSQLLDNFSYLNAYDTLGRDVFVRYLENDLMAFLILDVVWLGGHSKDVDLSKLDNIFALAGAALHCSIDEYATGKYKNIEFSEKNYYDVFQRIVKYIKITIRENPVSSAAFDEYCQLLVARGESLIH